MVDLILLELISIVSFLYSLMLMFTSFTSIDKMVLIFTWTIMVSMIFSIGRRKWKLFDLIALLLFLPLIFYKSKSAIFLISLTAVFTYIYVIKSLMKGNYGEYVYKLKISYLIYVPLFFISMWLGEDLTGSIDYALPFIVIYLISSIMLTRLIRHLESNMEISKIRRTNTKYVLTIFAGFLIIVFKELRQSIIDVLDRLITAIYYPLYKLLENFKIPDKMMAPLNNFFNPNKKIVVPGDDVERVEIVIEEVTRNNNGLAKKIIVIILFISILYIAYNLFIKIGSKKDKGLEYIEEREYIKERKKRKIFSREKFPREIKGQIRYYYRRFLDKAKKNDIEILKSDTSLDVNEKARETFEKGMERIREIYIETRYGNKEVDENTVKEIENLYRNL